MNKHSNACKEQKVPLRILFIEDEPLQAEIALDWLQESGYDIDYDVVERKNDFLDRLKSGSYDLILADYYLFDWTALDAFHCLQEAGDDTPMILVTGTVGDEHAVECIKAGITDYVLKEKLVRLPTVVSRALQEKAIKEERKQAETALRESEERYRQVNESIQDIIFSTNSEDTITFIAGACEELLGVPCGALLGKNLVKGTVATVNVSSEKLRQFMTEFTEAVKNDRETIGYEFALEVRGELRYFEVKQRVQYDKGGNFIGTSGIARDITERKRIEEELKKHRDHLEDLVKERTAELEITNAQLTREIAERKQAEERVKHLNRLKEDLLRPHSLDKKLKHITDGIVTIFDADFARIWISKPGDLCDSGCFHARVTEGPHVCRYRDHCLYLMASSGRYTHIDGKVHRRVPFGCYKIGRVAAGENPRFITNDVTHDPRVHDHDWAKKLGLVSFAGYQLLSAARKPIGVLALFSKHVISTEEDALLEGLANTTAQVIQTASAEEALRKLSRAMEQSPISVIITDREGNIEYVNEAFSKITGYSVEETIGQNFRILNSGDLPKSHYKDLWDTILSGKVWKGDLINKKKNGENLWESVSISPIWNDEGKITHFVAAKEDITHRKRLEEELIQAKLEAEAANRAKSEFLANISHEIRTPLNAVLGYAQILQNAENLTTRQVDALKTIKSSGEHLLHLINEILDLSKIEAGHLELQLSEFHFPEFLDHIADMIRVRAEQTGIAFVYEHAPDLPGGVYADEKRLRQVLLNVLGNAVKFTEQGSVMFRVKRIGRWGDGEMGSRGDREFGSASPHLPISLSPLLPISLSPLLPPLLPISPAPHLRFEVEDTGIGIASERFEEIFLPFHQVGEQHGVVEGTGLGLPISQKLVRMMGGELHVESTVGQGSIFWFTLDLPVVEGVIGRAAQSSHKIIGYKGKRCTVLVADDKRENRTVLVNMLLPLGFDVIEAENGEECIEKTMRFTPDMILLDLRMPVMDGFETARRIRELDTGYSILDTGIERPATSNQQPATSIQHPASNIQHPVIVAISASAFEETRRKSLEAGCSDFLSKPFQEENLLELLQTHLRLEWVYKEAVEERTVSDFQSPIVSASDVSLPPEEVEILHRIAERGNVKHILEQLQHIEKLGDQFLPLVTELRTLAKSFQVDKIVERLEEMEK